MEISWAARELDRGLSAPRVPEGEHLDAARRGVDLVVEVIASPAEQKAANTLPLGAARSRSNSRLGRDEFKGSLEVVCESERGGGAIGSPPR
jgi:hypothetical protein